MVEMLFAMGVLSTVSLEPWNVLLGELRARWGRAPSASPARRGTSRTG